MRKVLSLLVMIVLLAFSAQGVKAVEDIDFDFEKQIESRFQRKDIPKKWIFVKKDRESIVYRYNGFTIKYEIWDAGAPIIVGVSIENRNIGSSEEADRLEKNKIRELKEKGYRWEDKYGLYVRDETDIASVYTHKNKGKFIYGVRYGTFNSGS